MREAEIDRTEIRYVKKGVLYVGKYDENGEFVVTYEHLKRAGSGPRYFSHSMYSKNYTHPLVHLFELFAGLFRR